MGLLFILFKYCKAVIDAILVNTRVKIPF
ncbi:hypothetical protein EZS27_040939, partial [termite gut metagenome]